MKHLTGVLAAIVLTLTMAAGCPKPGTVINRRANCKATRTDIPNPPKLCTYQLRTQKGQKKSEWFDVTKSAYNACFVGAGYPECADGK